MLTVKGVVLTQRQVGEQDQYIDILTDEYGVLEVLVKGAKKLTSKGGPAAQLFAYSTFCLRPAKRGYALNSAEPIRIFYGLRNSVSAVALASYFSQVIQFAVLPQACTQEIQRLFLNSLHFLSEQTHPQARIKAVFELRIASRLHARCGDVPVLRQLPSGGALFFSGAGRFLLQGLPARK